MAQGSNNDKMLQAVLLNEQLMRFGKYSPDDVTTIAQARESDNYVINVVAQIIERTGDNASEKELWKEVSDYLKKNV
jgi:hypothetical protein